MEVYTIRHTSVDVPPGTCYGWTDVPLSDSFPEEAAATRQRLEGITFDGVFSSPLSRATRLAAACGFPSPRLDARLKEMHMGLWEMRRYDDIEREDPAIRRWYDDYMNLAATGGESYRDLYRRVASFFDELRRQPYHRVAVFAHGGVLVCAGVYAGLFPEDNCFSHLTPYGGIQRFEL